VTIAESVTGESQLGSTLRAGLETIDAQQTVTFTKYVRLVLPLDGFVFWVRAELVSYQALIGAMGFGNALLASTPTVSVGAPTITVAGSLHYSSVSEVGEEESYAVNRVTFTSESEIQDLNEVSPNIMYLGAFNGLRFAFAERGNFYEQAQLYHYVGNAVYPTMNTQIIDDVVSFNGLQVVSNSLPLWLALNPMMPQYPYRKTQVVPLYPSFLVPDNISPPYAAIHVIPESQHALQAAPTFDRYTTTHTQLVCERVKITFYGLRNDQALDFLDYVNQYTLDSDAFGIMNMPVMRDEKRLQIELGVLAQRKVVEFEINYYQTRVNDIARQLILKAIPTIEFLTYSGTIWVPPIPPTPPLPSGNAVWDEFNWDDGSLWQ
jgi:hypothetical protein